MKKKINCPVCSNRMKYVFTKFECQYFTCVNCKYGLFDPLPDKKKIMSRYSDSYFQNEYLSSYGVDKDSYKPDIIKKYVYIEKLLNKNKYFETGFKGKALDIGCGGGFLLKYFKEKKWDVLGFDIIDSSIKYSKQVLNVKAEKVNFETVAVSDMIEKYGKFDLIIMTDALEHFFEPDKILEKVYKLLSPNGVFFFSVPNIESISYKLIGKEWAIISPFEHISYFSSKSLKILLKDKGFLNINTFFLQYVNTANIHKKNKRYEYALKILPRLTKFFNIALEGRENYEEALKTNYIKNKGKFLQGDILIGMAQKTDK